MAEEEGGGTRGRAHDSSGPAAAADWNIITAAARVLSFLLYLVSRGKIRQVCRGFLEVFMIMQV